MRAALLLAALAACSSPGSQAPLSSHAEPAAPAPAPTTPPPNVVWIDNGFDVNGLPAITADGQLVVTGEIEADGGRGNPSLRIVARDRHDAVTQSITVLKVDEVDAMFEPNGTHPQLEARMSAANTWLAKLHHDHDLRPLPALTVDAADAMTQHAAKGAGGELDWQHDQLRITAGGKTTTLPTPATWHAPARGSCENPSKLGAAWLDPANALALVLIAYNGTDTCWEPSSQYHVVTW